MTDQEINEAVARKLGVIDDLGTIEYIEGVKNYCRSIEAAWEIVEILEEKYECYLLVRANAYSFKIDNPKYERQLALATDESAPMAICKAFLKLP